MIWDGAESLDEAQYESQAIMAEPVSLSLGVISPRAQVLLTEVPPAVAKLIQEQQTQWEAELRSMSQQNAQGQARLTALQQQLATAQRAIPGRPVSSSCLTPGGYFCF